MASISKATAASGKRWRVRWIEPDDRPEATKPWRWRERAFRTKYEADTFLADRIKDPTTDPRRAEVKVSALLDTWLTSAGPRLSPKTLSSYRSLARALLAPSVGSQQVGRLNSADLQRHVGSWQKQGLSPSRIRQAVRLLGQVLDVAVADGVLTKNPVTGVKLPAMPTKRTPGFTPEEADKVTAALPERWRLLGDVLSHAGLRWAEAAGLTVQQIDFDKRRMTVDRSTSQVDGHLHDRTTKSGRARSVPMTAEISERLRGACAGLPGDARVFTMSKGGVLRYDNVMRSVWRPTMKAAGITGSPHGMRKAAATRFLRAGVAPHVVARILGHGDVQVTLSIYSEVVDQDLDQAAALIEFGAGLGPASPGKTEG